LRIAQVAPLFESVPPAQYGGTERVVSYLTEELVRLGHEVTLFATADSHTDARLVSACPRSLRAGGKYVDATVPHVVQLDQVRERATEFDVAHYHTGYLQFPLARALEAPRVTTMHGRLDLPELDPLLRHFDDEPLVSISDGQRGPVAWAKWIGTVHHGLPVGLFHAAKPATGGDAYLAFVGRISPEKAPDRAIEIARRCGRTLKIAAKVDDADRDYYERTIRPLLDGPGVEFVGEVDDAGKQALLGGALALLFPIDWPEPFGLVMIEALACGTPVIARRRGSVSEVIADGRTGLVYETVEEGVRAVERLGEIDRAECRRDFERRFSAERMARDYLQIYERLAPGAAGRTGTTR
jgi:glycosyltransferase involved in cell wall biosynthesis